jgi:SAM-dependent methyltransferase
MVNRLKLLYRRLPRPPSTNYNLRQLAHDPYALVPAKATILDLGGRDSKGRYAVFPRTPDTCHIISLDIELVKGVDLVGDAQLLPLKKCSVDGIFCVSVLEYVQQPQQVVREIHRVLKAGGFLYISVPFVFRYHPEPEDLYRFSMHGLRVLCSSFEEVQCSYNRGPASTTCDLLVHFCAILFSFNRTAVYNVLVDVFQWGLFWLKYLDRWIGRYKTAHIIGGGVFFFGRKPPDLGSKRSV